jgi:hypothetical protein
MNLKLFPNKIIFGVYSDRHKYGLMEGEVEIIFDSDETAWVKPCHHLIITEEIIDLIEKELKPMGIVWIRGWQSGNMQGRYIGDYKHNGNS